VVILAVVNRSKVVWSDSNKAAAAPYGYGACGTLVLQANNTFASAYGGRVFGKAMTDLVHSDSAGIDVIAI
jgi:hypothetical protein